MYGAEGIRIRPRALFLVTRPEARTLNPITHEGTIHKLF